MSFSYNKNWPIRYKAIVSGLPHSETGVGKEKYRMDNFELQNCTIFFLIAGDLIKLHILITDAAILVTWGQLHVMKL